MSSRWDDFGGWEIPFSRVRMVMVESCNSQLKLPTSKGNCWSVTEMFKCDPSCVRISDRSRGWHDVFSISSLFLCPLAGDMLLSRTMNGMVFSSPGLPLALQSDPVKGYPASLLVL